MAHGHEREAPLVEDRLRLGVLLPGRGVEDRIVRATLLAAKDTVR
jgi:hypothetical protein